MPIFEFQAPNGQTFEFDAPDQASALAAFQQAYPQTQSEEPQPEAPQQRAGGGSSTIGEKIKAITDGIEADQSYSGGILPFSKDAEGNVSFDSDAGVLGAAKRFFTLPSEVYRGEVDPLSEEGMNRAMEAAAVMSPINPAVRAGSQVIPGVSNTLRQRQAPVPSADELLSAGGQQFDDLRALNVDYNPQKVAQFAQGLEELLYRRGFTSENAPRTSEILKSLRTIPKAGPDETVTAPLQSIDIKISQLNKVKPRDGDGTDMEAARLVRDGLSQFVQRNPDGAAISGPAELAGSTMAAARGNYAAGKRSNTVGGIGESAELRAAAANSGQNLGNTIRGRMATLTDPQYPMRARGFNAEEKELLEGIARGTIAQNATRNLGNLLGGGGGLGALASTTAGGMVGGVPGAIALPAAGMASKAASNAMTKRALKKVDEAIRRRSPLFLERQAAQPFEPDIPLTTEAIIRALLAGQLNQGAN